MTGVPAEAIRRAGARLRHAPTAPSCAGPSASPSTTTASTTCCALINLALLTGHVGRYGSGLNPLRGQNNVQGGGDMGAIPNRLPGFQDILDPEARPKFERRLGPRDPAASTACT